MNIIISTGPDGGGQQSSKTVTFNLPDSGEIVSVQVIDGSGNTVWGPEEKDTNLEVAVEVTVSGLRDGGVHPPGEWERVQHQDRGL